LITEIRRYPAILLAHEGTGLSLMKDMPHSRQWPTRPPARAAPACAALSMSRTASKEQDAPLPAHGTNGRFRRKIITEKSKQADDMAMLHARDFVTDAQASITAVAPAHLYVHCQRVPAHGALRRMMLMAPASLTFF